MEKNGWVTIGFKGDTKQLEKDIKIEEQRLKQFEKESQKLTTAKIKAEKDLEAYYQEIKLTKELTDETLTQAQTQEEVDKVIESENFRIQEINEKYSTQLSNLNDINKKIEENTYQQGLVNFKISEMNAELKKSKGFDNINKEIKNVGKSVEKVTKKIGRWGLALFGIRAMYGFIRNAVNTISNNDDQLRADIDYMKSALAYTLEPLVRSIVNLAKQLMFYVGYIVKAWTGVNIFENANKGLTKANKQAKELQKTTASFDEMNIVGGGTSSSGTGTATPSFDLSKGMEDVDVPKWIKWLAEHPTAVKDALIGIGTGLYAVGNGLGFVKGAGLFLVVDGLERLFEAIKNFDKDKAFDSIGNILRSIGEIAGGGALIAGVTSPLGLVLIVIEEVLRVIGGLFKDIQKLIELIQDPSWEKFGDLLYEIWKHAGPLNEVIGYIIDNVLNGREKVVEALGNFAEWIYDNVIKPVGDFFQGLWDKIVEIFSPVGEWFKNIFTQVYDNVSIIIEDIKIIFSFLWDKIVEIFSPVVNFIGDKFREAKEKIKEVFGPVIDWIGDKIQWVIDKFNYMKDKFKEIGKKIGDAIGGSFKKVLNGIIGAIENTINTPATAINKLIDKIKVIPGLNKLKSLNTVKIPRLAKGGIINMPGRGVPVGNAIGGERGAEGVLPLTDSQQMAMLGEMIGRYITVNLTNITKLDSRQIARKVDKVQQNNNFVFNR